MQANRYMAFNRDSSINMKQSLVIFITLICAITNSQTNKNQYHFDKVVEITQITLRKSIGNEYRKSYRNIIDELEFSLEKDFETNDTICYLRRFYAMESREPKDRLKKEKEKVDLNVFYDMVKKLNQVDVEKINIDFNVADGISYSISMYGGKYSLSLSSNLRNKDNVGYFDLFDSIWKQFQQ